MRPNSNTRRAERRQECREALASHIYRRLGLTIPLDRVRLQPSADDGYAWSVSEAQKHLLETPLGRGTLGLYQDIMAELGKSIEAVKPQILQKAQGMETSSFCQERKSCGPRESFTEVIQRLESENEKLVGQIEEYRAQVDSLSSKEQEWHSKMTCLHAEVDSYQQVIRALEEDVYHARTSILDAVSILESDRYEKVHPSENQADDVEGGERG